MGRKLIIRTVCNEMAEKNILHNDYGLSPENPVQCGLGPKSERSYLERLRCPNGHGVRYSRCGSIFRKGSAFGGGGSDEPIDRYQVVCLCEERSITVYMDKYTQCKDRPKEKDMNPELDKFIGESLEKLGDNPIPVIIEQLVAEGITVDGQTWSAILLGYIGEPAIPYMIELLGGENYNLAEFAAKTLAGIEGTLHYVISALKSDDSKTRLHAAGSLQFFGPEASQAIPDLCDLIKREILESEDSKEDEFPMAAGVASGALGRIGAAAIPATNCLLRNDNPKIRIVAVSAMLRIGKPALPLLREAHACEKDPRVSAALKVAINDVAK